MERKATYRMTEMAILTALSIVLLLLIQFPIFPATPYLKYDMADVPVILGGLLLGPLPGLLILALAAAIQAFLIVGDGIIGFVMHFLASSILMLLPALFFRHSAKKSNVIVGGVLGGYGRHDGLLELNLYAHIYRNAALGYCAVAAASYCAL